MAKKTTRKQSATKKTTRKAATKKATRGGAAKKTTRKAAKRELISPRSDKRYVRRDARGAFKESDDVGKSLAADRRRKAARKVKPGQGDKGDR